MQQLIIQNQLLMLVTWTILNLTYCCLSFLNGRLFRKPTAFDNIYQIKYLKRLLWLVLWLGFGIGMLSAARGSLMEEDITADKYFIYVGVFFFIVIGFLLTDIRILATYFVYRKQTSKMTYSFNRSMILHSFDMFGYSALILLSFLITKDSLLLGGAIGLAFNGCLYLSKLIKQYYINNHDPEKQPKREFKIF